MSSTLHIDGLLASVSHQELTGMFAKFGDVRSINIYKADKESLFSVGTVEMASPGEASKAVQALHRSYLGGKLLLVCLAPLGAGHD